MIVNATCFHGNGSTCATPSSAAGLAVGLTFFFLLLVAVAGLLVYKFHSKIRNMLRPEKRELQVKEDYVETPQTDTHLYTRQQPVAQTPIYENLQTNRKAGYERPEVHQRWLPGEHEEDVYLQCDDAIYSNDPACHLAVHHDPHEDVYILPDT